MTHPLSHPVPWFRVIAVAEALSWAGLLIGMLFKYGPVGNEIGVTIFGPIHGGIFLLYVLISLLVLRPLRWRVPTVVLALLASIPPFGSLVFERWAQRSGRLEAPNAERLSVDRAVAYSSER